jgi:hypothetical protein
VTPDALDHLPAGHSEQCKNDPNTYDPAGQAEGDWHVRPSSVMRPEGHNSHLACAETYARPKSGEQAVGVVLAMHEVDDVLPVGA